MVGTVKRSHVPFVCECACDWVNADLCCKALWVVKFLKRGIIELQPILGHDQYILICRYYRPILAYHKYTGISLYVL